MPADDGVAAPPAATGDPLGAPLRAALAALAAVPTLLVCSDYDGTLSPLVADPSQARALPECVTALKALAQLPATHAAVVSGRARADLAALSGLGEPVILVGSHGAEFSDGTLTGLDPQRRALRAQVAASVRALLAEGRPGVLVEEKPASVAVHVRQASREDAAYTLDAVRRGPGATPGVHLTVGHEVLELSVIDAGKGHAVDVLRRELAADAVLFVGDDVTDENAFARLRQQQRGTDVGVKVGPGRTGAAYRVASPREVTPLLELLLAARSAAPLTQP